MDDRDNRWRRAIEPNRALDPTYARPQPWFVGSGKGLMIGVLGLVAVLGTARIASTVYLADELYRWWRAAIPTRLPTQLPAVKTSPSTIGDVGAWFPPDSYPSAARLAGVEGRVAVSLLIGEDGRPQACEVTQSSGSAILDAATCRLAVRHGQFAPARDRAGRPVVGRYAMRGVRWQLDD